MDKSAIWVFYFQYQNLLTRLYFQSWTAYCWMSEVMFIAVPSKHIQQSQILYQSCNSVPCFVSYSKLLWSILSLKVLSFHLKIFYNAIRKNTEKSDSTVAYNCLVQICLFIRNFFLCDFALTWLENLCHFSNLRDHVRFNVIWHRWYAITFSLTWGGMCDLWLFLSCVRGQQEAMSTSCHQYAVVMHGRRGIG